LYFLKKKAFCNLGGRGSLASLIVRGCKKYFTPANLVLAIVMFLVFFILRTYLLPPFFTLQIGQLPNILFEVSIPKDLLAGGVGVFIRLGLKGIIEDIIELRFPTQKMPISHIMTAEQDNGSALSGPSGSSGEPDDSEGSGSGSEGSGSYSAGPSNDSKGDGINPGDYVIGNRVMIDGE
jgi:hypothetical protein